MLNITKLCTNTVGIIQPQQKYYDKKKSFKNKKAKIGGNQFLFKRNENIKEIFKQKQIYGGKKRDILHQK